MSHLMLGKVIFPKYLDLGSPVLDVHIDGVIVPNTLIDLGATINIITKETMLKLNLQGTLRKTTTVLQLADRSTVTSEGIVEDVMVTIDSWEYPTYFIILQLKTKFNGYPPILGRPWLASADACISCRAINMTIKYGPLSKQLMLYPPAQPSIHHDLPIWLEDEEDELYKISPMCIVDVILRGGQLDEDYLIDHAIQNQSSTNIPLKILVKDFES